MDDMIREQFEKFYINFLNNNKTILNELEKYRENAIKERKKRNIIIGIAELIALLMIICTVIFIVANQNSKDNGELMFMASISFSIVAPIIISFILSKKVTKYEEKYKETLIRSLIEDFAPSLKYFPNESIDYDEYKEIGLEHCNEFYSKDVIRGMYLTNQVTISKIVTQYDYFDSSSAGGGGAYETFDGIFAKIKLSNIFNDTIYIKRKTLISEKLLNVFVKDINQVIKTQRKEQQLSEKYEKLDIDKLNDKFIIYTSNSKNQSLFDANLVENLIKIDEKQKYEVIIKDSSIYIKLWGNGLFVIPTLKKEIFDKEVIYENYKILYTIFYLSNELEKRLI